MSGFDEDAEQADYNPGGLLPLDPAARHPDELEVSEVIRPAAILSEVAARRIVLALESAHVTRGGLWRATPGTWERWDEPWESPGSIGSSQVLGVISCVYDSPERYSITVFRAGITPIGLHQGWTVERLCDEAFSHAGLTLASCPRATLSAPPPIFRMR